MEIPLPIKCVASLLGVSEATIFRKMNENAISTKILFSSMSDEKLDNKVAELKARVPHAGYRLVKGLLQSEEHHIQWNGIKGCVHRIDSAGVLSHIHFDTYGMHSATKHILSKDHCQLST